MEYVEGFDAAAGHARMALALLEKFAVPPNPNNFAIAYLFCAKRHPELQQAMAPLVVQGKFDAATCATLYNRFLGRESELAELQSASERIDETLSRVLDFMATAQDGAASYGEAIAGYAGKLKTARSAEDLGGVITALFSETRNMAAANKQLETKLSSSSQEIAQLRQHLDEVKRESTTDALTGIANRRLFDLTLDEAALTAQQDSGFLCLLMIDIDHFKKFNDTYGHQMGDHVLKLVGKTLTDCVKGQDLPARYGGEEFGVILPRTHLGDALKVAETIRRQVADKKVVNRKTGQSLGQITLSIGAAEYAYGEATAQLVQRADAALYQAKHAGRNRVMSQRDLTVA